MKLVFIRICKFLFFSIHALVIASCGGGGGGDSNNNNPVPTSDRIFVRDAWTGSISSVASANPGVGSLTIDTAISGPNTNLGNINDMVLDIANDRLYVANSTSILVFNNVSTATGNVAPSRTITSTSFGAISHLFYDDVNDDLYATDDLKGVWVISDISGKNGNITPSRQLINSFNASSYSIQGVAVDLDLDLLYVSVRGLSPSFEQIQVFNNARAVDGTMLSPDRVFTSNNTGGNPGQIVLDEVNDRLFMVDSGSNAVRVFDTVSTLAGSIDPDRTISFGVPLRDLDVDFTNDRLYVISSSTLYIVSNTSLANGAAVATALTTSGFTPALVTLVVAP